ncbi:MAG: 30S ribosomal protein S11 [Rickettsiales bacterium]|nr:30S ribosomal protein S11 [Rickettsiales bacterium]
MAAKKQESKEKSKNQKIVRKKKVKKNIPVGVVHICSSFNNTIINITDPQGNTVSWASAGGQGFRGAKKSTPYAAQIIAEVAGKRAQEIAGMKTVSVEVKGPGSGRESAIRALMGIGFTITTIQDITPVAHNGCRPPKQRRV